MTTVGQGETCVGREDVTHEVRTFFSHECPAEVASPSCTVRIGYATHQLTPQRKTGGITFRSLSTFGGTENRLDFGDRFPETAESLDQATSAILAAIPG